MYEWEEAYTDSLARDLEQSRKSEQLAQRVATKLKEENKSLKKELDEFVEVCTDMVEYCWDSASHGYDADLSGHYKQIEELVRKRNSK